MTVYRSAMGKIVDMAALAAKNQRTRAVGNMKVNARGDTIDSFGRVIQPVTEKVTDNYSKTVGNRSAHAVKPRATRSAPTPPPARTEPVITPIKEELTNYERELSEDLDQEDKMIEAIKAKDNK